MPEGRPFPYNFLPKPGAALSVTFGEPVPAQEIQDTLATLVREKRIPEHPSSRSGGLADPSRPQEELLNAAVAERGWLGTPVAEAVNKVASAPVEDPLRAIELARVRSAVTAVIQGRVEELGMRVLGLRKA